MNLLELALMLGWGYLWNDASPDRDISLLLMGYIWIRVGLISWRLDDIAKLLKK